MNITKHANIKITPMYKPLLTSFITLSILYVGFMHQEGLFLRQEQDYSREKGYSWVSILTVTEKI